VAIRGYLDLARLQTAGVTATVPVYGYLGSHASRGAALPDPLRDPLVVALFAMGFFIHIWGFVHNEIADRETDRRAATARPKPLPSGRVTLAGAWALGGGGLAAAVVVAAWVALQTDMSVVVLVVVGCALAALYNVYGKSFPGGDILLAAAIALFVCAGGATAVSYGALGDPIVLPLAVAGGMVLFFNNAFEGGFKDHASDALGGKRTLVIALRRRGERYGSPDGLVALAHWPVHLLLAAIAVWLALGPLSTGQAAWDGGRVGIAVLLTAAMARFFVRGIAQEDRTKMLTFFSLHEICAVVLLLSTISPFLTPALLGLLFFVPLVWYVGYNRAAYGTAAAPNV
jgi:4-hydroxybenzoate polyprenyltransferase